MGEKWFENTSMGGYVCQKERRFFQQNIDDVKNGITVQFGMKTWLKPSESIIYIPDDVRMDVCFQAWDKRSIDVMLLSHAHEYAREPLRALSEVARVLKPEGKLLLTGFNPYSLWRMSRWFDGEALPLLANCFTLSDLKTHVKSLGFEIEYGQFMVYLPPVVSENGLQFWQFLEKAGDRWWPQAAAVYGLVLRKRMIGMTPLSELAGLSVEEQSMALNIIRAKFED